MTELQRAEGWMKWVIFFALTLALSALANTSSSPLLTLQP
jgi:hypothetical protein